MGLLWSAKAVAPRGSVMCRNEELGNVERTNRSAAAKISGSKIGQQ